MPIFTAMVSTSPLMTATIMVIVVFAALLALSLVIGLFAKFGATEKKDVQKSVIPAKPVASAPVVSAPIVVEDENEVAAVIAAAVAMMAPAGKTYRIRRITPVGGRGRSEWAVAAIRQNTMPF